MARRWTHRCARNLARVIEQEAAISRQCAQFLIRERLKCGVRVQFSQQLWRGLEFDTIYCSADWNRRITLGFGYQSRSFGTIKALGEKIPGETLEEAPRNSVNRPVVGRSHRTSSSVRRLKERGFDDIIAKEKELRIVLSIKDLLGAEPRRSMTLLDLGKSKDDIGFKAKGTLVAFLKRYPAVFRIHETSEFGKLPWFRFTPEAEAAFDEELEIRKSVEHNEAVVTKLRKLLMMSSDRTLSLSKIAHLGRDLGLPDGFRKRLVYEFPRYFRVVGSKDPPDVEGPKLELVRWSSRLAVTEDEKNAQEQQEQEFGRDSLSMSNLNTQKRHRPSKFDEVECPSPYQDGSHLHRRSMQFEKRAVLLVQELLSLTLEKRVLVDHLTHFRKEFNFSKKLHGMLIRHPEHFYVSRKGARETVFLRRAFEEIRVSGNRKEYALIDKHPLVLVKEKLAALMEVNHAKDSNVKSGQVPFQERGIPAYDHAVPAQGCATPKIPW